jgi:hypothetical protein
MTILIVKIQLLWSQMEFVDAPTLLSINEQSRLYQVIDALEDFARRTAVMHKEE